MLSSVNGNAEAYPATSGGDSSTTRRRQAASHYLGKKFADASRLVIASNAWIKTIPTRNCDILLTFPPKTNDNTLMWFLSCLRSRTPKISVHVRHHGNTGVYAFYMTATYENLLREAEDLGIKKLLKDEFGGGMQDFRFEDKTFFKDAEDEHAFFTSEERQFMIRNMLNDLRAEKGEQVGKIKFLEGQAIVPLLDSKGVISQVLPLHHNDDLVELRKTWVQAFFRFQPLEKIGEYFGVKIAMYFAYLGHYTAALYIPAIVGLLMWCAHGRDQFVDDVCFVGFALFNVVWATLYLEDWKRRSAELAFKWGTLDKKDELLEDPRPLFKGYLITSPVTGRQEPYYPAWKRNIFRYFVSIPVMCFCLCVVFVVMLIIFQIQEWINGLIKAEHLPKFAKFLPKILLAVSIGVLDDIYKKIARWLNDKENYRLDESYENHLIIKLVLFQFVNSFLSLFYIAFYLRDMGRLKEQLAALLITKQVIGNIKEALLPWVVWKMKLLKTGYKINKQVSTDKKEEISQPDVIEDDASCENPDTSLDTTSGMTSAVTSSEFKVEKSGANLTQAEVESAMKQYEDTFEDYLEMVIQFGYVTLFSPAFPMAAMCALLNNVIEIRSDAFKLCVTNQRPFGQRVESIGTWQDALELLGVIAVIVNCCLVGVFGHTQRLAPGLDDSYIFILIVVLEHAILFLKFGIAYAIPDIPEGVATQMARLEFLRRDALKKVEAKSQPTGAPPNSPVGLEAVTTTAAATDESVSTVPQTSVATVSSAGAESRRAHSTESFTSSTTHPVPETTHPRETTSQPLPPPRSGTSNAHLLDDDVSSAISYLKSGSRTTTVTNPSYRLYKSTSSQVTQRKSSHETQSSQDHVLPFKESQRYLQKQQMPKPEL